MKQKTVVRVFAICGALAILLGAILPTLMNL
ncbi:MAG: hypothetical protein JWM56_230 [Candidatus Peribacteria bacterium]|nr:hypothetical protein [Candidatus Peribacteria bacterium]